MSTDSNICHTSVQTAYTALAERRSVKKQVIAPGDGEAMPLPPPMAVRLAGLQSAHLWWPAQLPCCSVEPFTLATRSTI